jgi:hypothetical protein
LLLLLGCFCLIFIVMQQHPLSWQLQRSLMGAAARAVPVLLQAAAASTPCCCCCRLAVRWTVLICVGAAVSITVAAAACIISMPGIRTLPQTVPLLLLLVLMLLLQQIIIVLLL